MVDRKPFDYVLGIYLAGLAVETILQAHAMRAGGSRDAKHSLPKWLAKCPIALHQSLKASAEWNLIVAVWSNEIRYLSFDGLLGFLRAKGYARGRKGGVESIVRRNAVEFVDAAEHVHKKGIAVWVSFTEK